MKQEPIQEFYDYVDGRRRQPTKLPSYEVAMVRAALEAKFTPRRFSYDEVTKLLKEERIPREARHAA